MRARLAATAIAIAAYLPSGALAITISVAKIDKGAVQVRGSKAQPLALLTWEGQTVAQALNSGRFRFATGVLPEDCIGELSDGTDSIPVVIQGCGPQGPPGPAGSPGPQGPPGCGVCSTSTPVATPMPTATQTPLPIAMACGGTEAPQCDGTCPQFQTCSDRLVPGTCECSAAGFECGHNFPAPQCWGECPPESPVCRDIEGVCQCSPF